MINNSQHSCIRGADSGTSCGITQYHGEGFFTFRIVVVNDVYHEVLGCDFALIPVKGA
ncbi:hypothetical protein THIOM_002143 [Candidatus Thiomargarita nelsonii]|uniref:Uncharacterized protein n=1 Tax=Candidatus Thiomargarita nelsonii TaxID=1003181 RepID=A0A176S200_9GAMM|nr:hypothetical protein THIOM_002143 [Candidatus Thiomargarita nelsonii]